MLAIRRVAYSKQSVDEAGTWGTYCKLRASADRTNTHQHFYGLHIGVADTCATLLLSVYVIVMLVRDFGGQYPY